MDDDWRLLEAWQAGDTKSGGQLFDRHFQSVSRFFRYKLPDSAEDLIQRTFLAVVEGRERIRDTTSFKSYLFGVARNLLLRELRDAHRGREVDLGSQSVEDLRPGAATALGQLRDQRRTIAALRRIPIDFQIVLELYYWEELSAPEIASVLGAPVGTVRSRLRRAKELLAEVSARLTAPNTSSDLDPEAWAQAIRSLVDEEA